MNIVLKCVGLLLMTFVAVGLTCILNEPGSLEHYIITTFDITTSQFSYLYGAFSLPGAFSIIIGVVTDKYIGLKMLLYLSATIVNVGCVLYSIAAWNNIFWLMVFARFIMGIGDTSMFIGLQSLVLLYYKNENIISIASSVVMSVPWIGSSLVFFISNRLEKYISRYYDPSRTLAITSTSTNIPASVISSTFILVIYFIYSKYILKEKEPNKDIESKEKLRVKGVLEIPLILWIIIIVSTFSFVTICNLIMISQELFMKLYSLNVTESSNLSSIFAISICVLSPLSGFIVDTFGKNLTFATIGMCITTLTHGLMAFTSLSPYCLIVFFAVSYVLTVSAVWPMLDYLADKDHVTTACGAFETSIGFLNAVGSAIAGIIIDKYSHSALELFYFILTISVLPFWIIVWKVDFGKGGVLNMSPQQRKYINM